MSLTTAQRELDTRICETIDKVSPTERFQRLDAARQFDHALHAALGELGLWGLGVPAERGGSGGDTVDQMIALRALGHRATSMGMLGVVTYLCTRILDANATEAQREKFVRPLLRGTLKASFCLTESQGGTDILRLMTTSASRVGSGYVLRGSKSWICGVSLSDFYIVVARTAPGKTDGVSMFLVPRGASGVSVRRQESFAVNGYDVGEIVFDDVEIETNGLLGTEGKGFRQLVAMLNAERLSAAANALGMAQGALKIAADYARDRVAFGKRLSELQAVQHKLANAALAYELGWTYLLAAAQANDRGEGIEIASSMAKLAAVAAAQQAADIGMEILGASAFDLGSPMQRYYRDHRLYVIAPINNDMTRSLLAERYFNFGRGF